MKSAAPFSSDRLRRFMEELLRPRLASNFFPYFGGRDLIRLRGNFLQMLALTGGRYGDTLKVLPTFYVVGARPWDAVISQSVALDALDPSRWHFQNVALDQELAEEICKRLAEASPLSFIQDISDPQVVVALQSFAKRAESESAALFLAFFLGVSAISDPHPYLKLARKIFTEINRPLVHEWQHNTILRFDELDARLVFPDRIALCRADAERHASKLRLPKLVWPW